MRALVETLVKRFCWMVAAGSLLLSHGAGTEAAVNAREEWKRDSSLREE